jgi:hypothetical protein
MNWKDNIDVEMKALREYMGIFEKTGKAPCSCQDKIDEEMKLYPWIDMCVEKAEKAPCACQDTSDSEDVTSLAWLQAAKDLSSYRVKFLTQMSEKKKGEKETMDVHEKNLKRLEMFSDSDEDEDRDSWDDVFIEKHNKMMEKSGLSQDIQSEDVMVHHPPHYERNGHECIDWIEMALTPEEFKGYLKGCAYKYQWRHEEKGHRERDLQKAQWYLKKLESLGEK